MNKEYFDRLSGDNFGTEANTSVYDEGLYLLYDQNLEFEENRKGSKIISLREIPVGEEVETLRLLVDKLENYKARVKRRTDRLGEHLEHGYVDGEDIVSLIDANYKRIALQILFRYGSINTWALGNTLEATDGFTIIDRFENAMGVVHDYIKTKGNNCL